MEGLVDYVKQRRDEVWQVEEDITDTLDSMREDYVEEGEIKQSDKIFMDTYEDEALRKAELEKVDTKMEKVPERALEERKNAVGGHKRRKIDQKRQEINELYQEALDYRRQVEESLNEVIIPSVEMIEYMEN
jgi:hypothetical protein